jgi:glucose-1-phosphate cytidylyltransferase
MLYTGQDTMTGGRIKKAQSYIGNEQFLLTYGDGVADINIKDLINSHKKSKKI